MEREHSYFKYLWLCPQRQVKSQHPSNHAGCRVSCPSSQPRVVYAGLALAALCWHWSELSSKQGWQSLAAEVGQEQEGEGFQPPDPRIKELAAKLG